MKYFILIFSFIVLLTVSCSYKVQEEDNCSNQFSEYKKKLSGGTEIDADVVTSHFPKKMCYTSRFFWQLRTNTPLFGANSYGILYVEQISASIIEKIKSTYSYLDSVSYYDTNSFRIRHFLINDTAELFDEDILSKYPLPTFYFGLIESDSVSQKWIDEIEITQIRKDKIKYFVPDDLMIYVIDAKAGFFFKDNENIPIRPKLGKWTNGYTRGIAISDAESFICYYFVIW